jgi:tetratricopeptide (TPR) repeat protein
MSNIFARLVLLSAVVAAPVAMAAGDIDPDVARIRDAWATLEYQDTADPHRLAKSTALENDAAAVAASHPTARALYWQAEVLCLTADILHSTASLGKVKQARDLLEKAQKLDPKASEVLAFLGTLYAQVPGWPLGYGNKAKAQTYLRQALDLSPDGIDANYFMADYLLQTGHADQAIPLFEKAQTAAEAAPSSAVIDGRRQDIAKDLAKARKSAG